MADAGETAITISGLRTQFGRNVIHDGLDLEVRRGEVLGIVGGSGTGKSVLVRVVLGLIEPAKGEIRVLGIDTRQSRAADRRSLERRWGVLYQQGALFSSLTVAQNVMVPLREHTKMSAALMREVAAYKIDMVGLPADAGAKFPSELSGGMRKRAGLARALALDPEILFLDEPTAGLDPIGAAAFDELIDDLQKTLSLTVVMVTHDLDSLYAVCDRVAALIDKRVIVGTIPELLEKPSGWIHEYFHGARSREPRANGD